MKRLVLGVIFLPLSITLANSQHSLPLWLSHQQYQQLLDRHLQIFGDRHFDKYSTRAIRGGQRLSQWLKRINQNRPNNDKIRLTDPESRHGIPIDKPSIYGPKQIKQRLDLLDTSLPAAIAKVVYGQGQITPNLPTKKTDFIDWGRKINALYETAVRFEAVIKPNIDWYKANKVRDVRGYYYLNKMQDLNKTLRHFKNLTKPQQRRIQHHLLDICVNNKKPLKQCQKAFTTARDKQQLVNFKNLHWQKAKQNWQQFFVISHPRSDVLWPKNREHTMTVYFKSPDDNRIEHWLKTNIEDEFQFKQWHLQMSFIAGNANTAYVKFESNVTPHVTNGNIVVMDANIDIDEYEVKWTIRHEYGHILRLPDCYVEFYDETIGAAVNYQLDINDLMCSRKGNMNKRIYQELKRVYYPSS